VPNYRRPLFVAPALHAFLFVVIHLLVQICNDTFLEMPSRYVLAVLFLADAPVSFVCMGYILDGNAVALIAWGVLGTVWWLLLGLLIEFIDDCLAKRKQARQ
jgi:hypothetical protein